MHSRVVSARGQAPLSPTGMPSGRTWPATGQGLRTSSFGPMRSRGTTLATVAICALLASRASESAVCSVRGSSGRGQGRQAKVAGPSLTRRASTATASPTTGSARRLRLPTIPILEGGIGATAEGTRAHVRQVPLSTSGARAMA